MKEHTLERRVHDLRARRLGAGGGLAHDRITAQRLGASVFMHMSLVRQAARRVMASIGLPQDSLRISSRHSLSSF